MQVFKLARPIPTVTLKSMRFALLKYAILLIALLLPVTTAAETWRTWKSTSGTEIEAKLSSQANGVATLEKRSGQSIEVKISQLSAADRQFLESIDRTTEVGVAKGLTQIAGLAAVPGTVSAEISCKAEPAWSYYLYLPAQFHTGRSWPVCFVMDAGGGSPGTLDRYRQAAESLGMILAVSKQSKNGFYDSIHAIVAMQNDVVERLPILPDLVIASGMSGGSRMAYLLAEVSKRVKGVLACGSGAGVYLSATDFRTAKLPKGVVICSLIGTNDFNRREAVNSHSRFDKDARLIWFPGNHDWAGEAIILEGLAHIYGKLLKISKIPEAAALRSTFSKSQLKWASEQQKSAPWATSRWAEFLATYPADPTTRNEAATLAAALAKEPRVVTANDAEKAVGEFVKKYFLSGSAGPDDTVDPAREKEAIKKAAEFGDLPQAEILRRLGRPAISSR